MDRLFEIATNRLIAYADLRSIFGTTGRRL
jgi:hypothetical protein